MTFLILLLIISDVFDNNKTALRAVRFIRADTLDAFARPSRDTHPVQSDFIFGGQILFVMIRAQKMPLYCGGFSSCRSDDFDVAKIGRVSGTSKFFREKVSFRMQNFSSGNKPRAGVYLNKIAFTLPCPCIFPTVTAYCLYTLLSSFS